MEVDYFGANSVTSLMEISGCTKFIINRVGQHKNAVPIFEHVEKSTNERAVNKFREWSSLTENSLPYEMILFNSLEDSELSGEELRNKKQGKVYKFTFCLNKKEQYLPSNPQHQQHNSTQNVAELIENALMKQRLQTENNEVLKKLQEMESRFAALEGDDDDDDDSSSLSGMNNPNMISLLAMLAKALGSKAPQAPTAVNGLQPAQIENINRAIKTLAKYDTDLDNDLLKLASLAESNTPTFQMLLKTLRSM